MEFILDPLEARALGALIEKEMTTPDHYPLTLNALINACNQKTNRTPVMELDEESVTRTLGALREKRLAWQVRTAGSRVPKYDHNIKEVAEFSQREVALLCVLLLRGPQTLGELRNRTARLYEFNGLSEVERTLNTLMEKEGGPFAVKLSRQAGHKENRYAHLFCGEVSPEEADGAAKVEIVPVEARTDPRIEALEEKVAALEAELAELREQFTEFARQFE